MIERLSIRNFKVLREVDLELKPLTVIVGPNASGKSTILEALSLLARFTYDGPAGIPNDSREWFRSRVANGSTTTLQCAGRSGEEEFSFGYQLYPEFAFLESAQPSRVPVIVASLLNLDPRKLAAPSHLKEGALGLPSDGEGLSSILAGISLEYPDRFREIVRLLTEVIPTVKNLRIRRATVSKDVVGLELLFDTKTAQSLPARAISEGTLLTLGLLTALSVTNSLQLVLIDDLERGLHPLALKDLVQSLRFLQREKQDLQIVGTSHSPYLLDNFNAEEVILTALDEDEYAIARPLTEHPEFRKWKGYMTAGEFWSSVGEGWVTENKPAKRRKAKTG